MNVIGVVWGGTASEAREHAATFLRAVGSVPEERPLVVMGPEHRNHDHFAPDPVPELLVDDLQNALAALPSNVEVLGMPHRAADTGWIHVRLADGRTYGLTTGCVACRCQAACASA